MTIEKQREEKRWTFLALCLRASVFPAAFAVAYAYFPYCTQGVVVCLWRNFFGIHCIGCGMTRALCHLARGDWHSAVHYNWLVIPCTLLLFGISVQAVWRLNKIIRSRPQQPSQPIVPSYLSHIP